MRTSSSLTANAVIGAAIAAVAGFSAGAFLFRDTTPAALNDVTAHCAIYASDTARADSIRIRCGLDRAGIEEILNAALESLGLDASQSGESVDAAALQAAADRLNVTMEAVAAALGGTFEDGGGDGRTPVEVLVEVADAADDGEAPADGEGTPRPRNPRPAGGIRTLPVSAVADEELLADAAGRVELDCAFKAGTATVRDIAIECGPKAGEINDLVQQFVDASGADDLREALARDETARAEFIQALADYYHLEKETVDELVFQLAATDSPWSGDAGGLDTALRARMERALAVVRIGQVAELMQRRQAEVAEALISAEASRADTVIRATGEELRPVADEFAPVEEPPTVLAARAIEEADAAWEEGEYGESADAYAQAADLMSRSLISDALRIMAVEAVELSDLDPVDYLDVATGFRLSSAERLASAAVQAGIDAAAALRRHGGGQIDPVRLQEAQTIVARLTLSTDSNIDPGQHHAVHSELAKLTTMLANRDRDPEMFREAAAAAATSLESARALGDSRTAGALITWGNTQLDLANHLGERSALAAAADAYREAADLIDPETNFGDWSAATANLAIVQTKRAFEEQDVELLEDAVATYRDLIGKLEEDSVLWQGVSTNYATTLLDLGAWRRNEGQMRTAIRELEGVLESQESQSFAWQAFETRQHLAAAWRRLGRHTQDEEAFSRAAGILAALQEVEGVQEAPGLWVRLKLEQARLHEEIGRLRGDADEFLTAAAHYSEAREPFNANEAPLLYSEIALYEAGARRAALRAGAPEDERREAETLALSAIELADAHGAEGTDWDSVRKTAGALIEELGPHTGR